MFAEFLQKHPMEDLLRSGAREMYPSAENRNAWDAIPEKYRQEIREMGDRYGKIPYPERSASGFLAFARTGDRQADEKPYFTRTGSSALRCCCAARFRTRTRKTW